MFVSAETSSARAPGVPRLAPARATGDCEAPAGAAGSLSRSSRRSRSAVFFPIPGIATSRASSLRATICASSSAGHADSTPSAVFGPMLETPSRTRNTSRSNALANPNRTSASSRTCVCTKKVSGPSGAAARSRPSVPSGASTS